MSDMIAISIAMYSAELYALREFASEEDFA